MKTILLIDGENFKGKLKSGITIDQKIFYFARITEHPESLEKSRLLIQEQRLLKNELERQGFEVILSGRVRGQMETLHKSDPVMVFKEKGVDVKIAVDMVTFACDKVASHIFALQF